MKATDWDTQGDRLTQHGFTWGPMLVERWASFPRSSRGKTRVIGIRTPGGHVLNVYVSPTGRSVRVFRDGKELQ